MNLNDKIIKCLATISISSPANQNSNALLLQNPAQHTNIPQDRKSNLWSSKTYICRRS